MGEFVKGAASVSGQTEMYVVSFKSTRELTSSEREAFANAIKTLAESFDCIAQVDLK